MTRFEEFEQYLENQLSPAEKAAFEQKLQQDADWARDFGLYKTMQADMKAWVGAEKDREALKQTLGRITGNEKPKAKLVPLRRYLWRVAALVIVVLALWQIIPSASRKSGQQLYAEYITEGSISTTRSGNNTDSVWQQAVNLFNEKKYEAAVLPLNRFMASGGDSTQLAGVLLAYCYLQTNKDSMAANLLLHKYPPGEAAERADWYYALLLLKTKQRDACTNQLTKISAAEGAYRQKAAALLKALRRSR
jgi:hypothetical protein